MCMKVGRWEIGVWGVGSQEKLEHGVMQGEP